MELSMVTMPSLPPEAMTFSTWWVLLSRIMLRMALFMRMISKAGTRSPWVPGRSCWEMTVCSTVPS